MPEQRPDVPQAAQSGELPGTTLELVRAAVREIVRHPDDGATLRRLICDMAREARGRSVPPERLLVSFKTVWAGETGAHPTPDRRAQADLLEEMVGLCIREYFASPGVEPA